MLQSIAGRGGRGYTVLYAGKFPFSENLLFVRFSLVLAPPEDKDFTNGPVCASLPLPEMNIAQKAICAPQWRGNLTWCELATKIRKVVENLVELVGIEPTTSSLRTMRSPS
jgi:hypothetical protein